MAKLFLFFFFLFSSGAVAMYNVRDFGAKPDGRTDSAKPFLAAWAAACAAKKPAAIQVPAGRYFLSQATFQGPCSNTAIRIYIDGTVLAPSGQTASPLWVNFKYVTGVSIYGGTLDGRGQSFWACKTAGKGCNAGATSLTISESKNVLISGLTSLNSEGFHMSIFGSSGVTVHGAKITAPGNSPNTDGIHVQMSSSVTITGTNIKTGDDCISMGEGTTDVWIEDVNCGPGHGISIGSLGGTPSEAGVRNITVQSVVLTGTQNGIRIKTWGKPGTGFVKGVTVEHITMNAVQNPIVIDQNYCPGNVNCPGESSGIKISGVSYSDVHGTSATPVAVKFDCSASNPCGGVKLNNIKLTYQNKPAQSYCKYAHGAASGLVSPPSCLR